MSQSILDTWEHFSQFGQYSEFLNVRWLLLELKEEYMYKDGEYMYIASNSLHQEQITAN